MAKARELSQKTGPWPLLDTQGRQKRVLHLAIDEGAVMAGEVATECHHGKFGTWIHRKTVGR